MLIYLADPTHESSLGLGSDTMPIQLGLIGAYCLKINPKIQVKIFKFVNELSQALEKEWPAVIGFSNYQWNSQLGYNLARIIKQKHPETLVVFGGVNYPETKPEQEKWLREHPAVDLYVHKDGELPFSELINTFIKNGKDIQSLKAARLLSCHAMMDNQFFFGDLAPRMQDLSEIPSPYILGMMDKFFEQKLVPTIRTNHGCPFSCTFCGEGHSYYNQVYKRSLEDKRLEMEYIVTRVKYTKTLRITDSNFGMFVEDVEFCRYLALLQERHGYPLYVDCSTGKNRKDLVLECNRILKGGMRLAASVQSLVPEVLANINRENISLDNIMALADQVSDSDTHSYSEIILGLPGDTLAGQKMSMSGLVGTGINNLTQLQLALFDGTKVNTLASREQFGLKGMFRPIQRCISIGRFLGIEFPVVEVQEICVATKGMDFDDYLEARRLYFTIGLFYNDRIFGEIHAFLQMLKLSTWEWLWNIHENWRLLPKAIRKLYEDFSEETRGELWESPDQMIADVIKNIKEYTDGLIGGNLIYKYRAKAIKDFENLHQVAFQFLKSYLLKKNNRFPEEAFEDIFKFSLLQKREIFENRPAQLDLVYDIPAMIKNAALCRESTLESFRKPTRLLMDHTAEQRELIKIQLGFYGNDLPGMVMMMSRFPLKRFYRTPRPLSNFPS